MSLEKQTDRKKFERAVEIRAKIMLDYYLEKSGIKSIIKATGKKKKGAGVKPSPACNKKV